MPQIATAEEIWIYLRDAYLRQDPEDRNVTFSIQRNDDHPQCNWTARPDHELGWNDKRKSIIARHEVGRDYPVMAD